MRISVIIAGTLAIGATAWILSGQLDDSEKRAAANGTEAVAPAAKKPLIAVRVRTLQARIKKDALVVNGRTEESRKVILRAETAGPITDVPATEGSVVEADDVIARQSAEDRNALLSEATALVKQREIEYRAATELAKKGFRSDTKLAEARALLDAARARTESIRIDISRTTTKAPFRGILEERFVEKGDYVKVGDNIASIVDLDPVLAVGSASERDIGAITIGEPGKVTFIGGNIAEGRIRYIASVADPDTRSFRIELEVPNPDHRIRAGLTGKLTLPLPAVSAHVLSPAVLTLSDDGQIGVRIVDADDIVRFKPLSILSQSPEGIWVSGLVDGERLITVGHEYVRAGEKVRAIAETAATGS
jgi:membrane fusion protein, multidrug efflux system